MRCNKPRNGYEHFARGEIKVSMYSRDQYHKPTVPLECGKCAGCITARARDWAIRLEHEAQFHDYNSFLTLTYRTAPLTPEGLYTFRPDDFVLFMKRLRSSSDERIRFFHAAEYGSKYGRPHHHVLLFGKDFADKRFHKFSGSGQRLYRSEEANELWRHGHVYVGTVTYGSAAYVAQYTTKKLGAAQLRGREPEYQTMSRRPGIGARWFSNYGIAMYERDDTVHTRSGLEMRPPRYYDKKLREMNPELSGLVNHSRAEYAQNNERTPSDVKEQIQRSRWKSQRGDF